MKVTIVYDNTASQGFRSGWGFSCLVDQRILFDTGEAAEPLFYNLNRLGCDLDRIEAVVISHDHWDHTGGLEELLNKRPGLKVYACSGFSQEFKNMVGQLDGKLRESETFLDINDEITVTGEISGKYKGWYIPEQALIVKTKTGISLITGCSHPGIVVMIQKVKEKFPQHPILTVLGGFHLMDKDENTIQSIVQSMKDMKVENVGPTHCTGQAAQMVFKKSYGKHYIEISAGKTVEV